MSSYIKAPKRRELIMKTALELFMQNGYEGTNMTDIVAISGGSLSSIYKFFDSKEGLFAAIIEEKISSFYNEMGKQLNLPETVELEEFLLHFGRAYIELFGQPETTALCRLIISEGYKNNKFGQIFSQKLMTKVEQRLVDFLKKEHIRVLFGDRDVETLAFHFCLLVREPVHIRCLLIPDSAPQTKKEREEIVRSAVDIFLRGALTNNKKA